MRTILILSTFIMLLVSCERELEFEVISETEPTLTVVVETRTVSGTTVTFNKVNGAEVRLYNNQTDFNNSAAPFRTKVTGADGKAVFTKTELVAKGIFYVRAVSGVQTGTKTTPYMILNDGETFLFVEIL